MVESAEFSWPLRVYIEDTDAGGIVYYVNYLKYMERARTELMRHCGFGKQTIFDGALMFVVHSMTVDYHAPARLDDELVATARLLESGAAYLLMEQRVRRGDELLCRAEVKIACVDRQHLKPRRIPREILAALQSAQGQAAL